MIKTQGGILETKEAKLTGPFFIKGLKVLVDDGDSQQNSRS
jgi:hypothetical protein